MSFFKLGILTAAFLWTCLSVTAAYGQSDSLKSLSRRFTTYQQQALQEKLFLHLDRPVYLSGETMWFKIYAVDGTFHSPLTASKVAYVEVLDQEQKPVLQSKVALQRATGQGMLVVPASLASGHYTVRAYTSWMKNFRPDFYFQSTITVVNTATTPGTRPVVKDSVAYDVQFFPEGGSLVRGLSSKVAFKVTDHTGKGLTAEGRVLDAQGKEVARFQTLRFGLGHFTFTPAAASTRYTAVIRLPGNRTVTRPLPAAEEQGYVLRLEDAGPDQLKLVVQARRADNATEDLFLLGHARHRVSVAATTRLLENQATFVINKKELADGISHFTVLNAQKQPLVERLYFRRPQQELAIKATTDQPSYALRQPVSVQVATGPAPANLSMAVYLLDSLAAAAPIDIRSFLWLTSDLKGTIENPGYYLTHTHAEATEALDNLMLTQGWSRFVWKDVFSGVKRTFDYTPELNGHLVQGKVTRTATGAPAVAVTTYLASPSRTIRLYTALSNANGLIQFETKNFFGAKEIIAQTDTQRDSMYRVEIFNPFSLKYPATGPVRPFTLPESLKAELSQRHLQAQVQQAYFRQYQNRYKAPTTDSLPFYGQADARYRLDDYSRFRVLEEVLREYVPGVQVRNRNGSFQLRVLNSQTKLFLDERPLVLLDGVPVFNANRIMAVDPLKIQRLDVMTGRYFHGPLVYSGIISLATYKGDLTGLAPDPHALIQEYEGMQWEREFYAPRYETPAQQQSRLPDLRNLLYWNPQIQTTATGATKLNFFSSDQAGTYLVVVQGLSAAGVPGSTQFTFSVRPTL